MPQSCLSFGAMVEFPGILQVIVAKRVGGRISFFNLNNRMLKDISVLAGFLRALRRSEGVVVLL